jgi:hypothetical protein
VEEIPRISCLQCWLGLRWKHESLRSQVKGSKMKRMHFVRACTVHYCWKYTLGILLYFEAAVMKFRI